MKTSVVVLSALAAHSVSATWFDQKPKTIVQSTPQQCSSQELNGLEWSDLTVGPIQKSVNYDFQGFVCRESPLNTAIEKRDIARSFPKNCITTDIEVEKFTNEISSTKQFSITNLYVSVNKEVDVEFQYSMPDGSICRQIQTCSSSGTKVTNTQCGGAINVKSRIFRKDLTTSTIDKCSLNIHKIEFNCGQSNQINSTSEDAEQSINPVNQVNSSSSSNSLSINPIPTPSSKPTNGNTDTSTVDEEQESEELIEKRRAYEGYAEEYDDDSSYQGYVNSVPSSAPSPVSISNPAPYSMPVAISSTPTYQSSVPVYSSAISPVNPNVPLVSITSVITVTTTSCTNSKAPAPSTPSGSFGCPEILPQCMQTYVKITQCVNNGDVNCLCPNSEFTKQVTSCIAAWGSNSNNDIPQAIEYLQGLCAAYIPKNPYIVVDVPTYISLPPPTGPVTTVSISSAMVVPETAAFTRSVVHIQSFVTKVVMTAITLPAVKIVPTGVSDAVIVPATYPAPALSYPGSPSGPNSAPPAPVVPGYGNPSVPAPYVPYSTGGARPFNSTGRAYNTTLFNTTNIMPPPSLGAANSLSPVRYTVVLVVGLVSFVLLFF